MAEFEIISDAPIDHEGLRSSILLSSPPHPGEHLMGFVIVSLWHSEKDGTVRSDIIVQPQDERRCLVHHASHILQDVLQEPEL